MSGQLELLMALWVILLKVAYHHFTESISAISGFSAITSKLLLSDGHIHAIIPDACLMFAWIAVGSQISSAPLLPAWILSTFCG